MKNNQKAKTLFGDEFKLKQWHRLNEIHVICPWCYNLTLFNEKSDKNECEVCRRRINEGDLENDLI
jgi:uncharacterized CHY-type Zn-finger protein